MEETRFQALPPLKRLRILQQQLEENKENEAKPIDLSFQLPSKKRKESRPPLLPQPQSQPIAFCLPAKKRVCAFRPNSLLVNNHQLSLIDLNIEYEPPCSDDEKIKPINDHNNKTPLPNNLKNQEVEEVKRIAKEGEEEDDGILCAICQSTDGDPADPIVFCDGCDLMVHTTCYGNPLIKGIPEGDWYCTQCLNSQAAIKSNPLSCCLCTEKGGALKPTKNGQWAHIVCAVLVPEVYFEDPDGREGIDCSKIPQWRWKGDCCVCKSRKGCVIGCSEPKCHLGFHVTCGLKLDYCIEYKQGRKNGEAIVAGFCQSHTELWKKQQKTGKYKIVAREEHKK